METTSDSGLLRDIQTIKATAGIGALLPGNVKRIPDSITAAEQHFFFEADRILLWIHR
jgi:hypothetical protein